MPNTHAVNRALAGWINQRIDVVARNWLTSQEEAIVRGDGQALFLAFSLIPRKIGKADAALTGEELEQAQQVRPSWSPAGWSVDQLARASVLLHFPCSIGRERDYAAAIDALFSTADVREQIALLRAIHLLPAQSFHKERALEAVRSNVTPVLEAIALDNPFPCEQFSVHEWNRMVLKALFLELAIEKIQGLDARRNHELARMAADLAQERRSAGRPVPERIHLITPGSQGMNGQFQPSHRLTTEE
jgi:hypothetical protein